MGGSVQDFFQLYVQSFTHYRVWQCRAGEASTGMMGGSVQDLFQSYISRSHAIGCGSAEQERH
jgi:hypothetical protein